MLKHLSLIICCLFASNIAFSQTENLLFEIEKSQLKKGESIENLILNKDLLTSLEKRKSENLEISIPIDFELTYDLELKKKNIFSSQGLIKSTNLGTSTLIPDPGVFYTGTIKGQEKSQVFFLIMQGDLVMRIKTQDKKQYKILLNEDIALSKSKHKIYSIVEQFEATELPPFSCQTTGDTPRDNNYDSSNQNRSKATSATLDVYLELDFATNTQLGSDAVAEITMLFGEVATLFQTMDGNGTSINLVLFEVFVHSVPDTYSTPDDLTNRLSQFNFIQTGADLAQLIHWSDVNNYSGGIADGIGAICGDNNTCESIANLGSYSGNTNFTDDYPRNIMAHEFGHCVGAFHTGCCVFGPNQNMAIETNSCGAQCDFPTQNAPACAAFSNQLDESVIMSYCWAGATQLNVNDAAPFHTENVTKICNYLNSCSIWQTCPNDDDCDGISNANECEGWEDIPNGGTVEVTTSTGCPEETSTITYQECDDNDDCTINDRLENCECVGDPADPNIEDEPSEACINNTGECSLVAEMIEFSHLPDGAREGITHTGYNWGFADYISSPDIHQGRIRGVNSMSQGGSRFQEGYMFPLCCPMDNDGRSYTITFDAGFFAYHDGASANIMVQGVQTVSGLPTGYPRNCTSNNIIECLATTNIDDTGLFPHPVNTGNTNFDDWWIQNNPPSGNEWYTMNSYSLNINPSAEINFILITLELDCEIPNHCFPNAGSTFEQAGGSLLLNNISVTIEEPPIRLSRKSTLEKICEVESADEFFDPSDDCTVEVCIGDDLKLEVLDLDKAPYNFDESQYEWKKVGANGLCEKTYNGKLLCLENFDEEMAGNYVLTVFDEKCGCTNEVELEIEIYKPKEIECSFRYVKAQTGEEFEFNGCELYMCPDDCKELEFNFGNDITIVFTGDDPNPNPVIGSTNISNCFPGNSSIPCDRIQFGYYLAIDNNCSSNVKEFAILEDTPPDPNYIVSRSINNLQCTTDLCVYYGTSSNHPIIEYSLNGINWTQAYALQTQHCFKGLAPGNYILHARWADTHLCCMRIPVTLDPYDFGVEEDVDDALCDADNGSITLLPEDYDYSWSTGSTENRIECLSAGTYTVTLIDDYGCKDVRSYTIKDIDEDIITASGGKSGFNSPYGIKLPEGKILTWCFRTWWIADQLKIMYADNENFIGEYPLLNTTAQTCRSVSCCNNNKYCNCSGVYLGDLTDGQDLDYGTITSGFGATGTGECTVDKYTDCSTLNKTYGTIEIPADGFVRVEVVGQPCSDVGDRTHWQLIVACGEAETPCKYGDRPAPVVRDVENLVPFQEDESGEITANEEIDAGNAFSISPNPSSGIFKLEIKESIYIEAGRVIDVTGRTLSEFAVNGSSKTLDLSYLAEGTYFIQLVNEEMSFTEKVVIQK